MWYSKDGITWENYESEISWSSRHEISAFAFQGNLWIACGNGKSLNNDVWSLDIPGMIFVSSPLLNVTAREFYQYNAKADFNEDQESINYEIVDAPPCRLSIDANTGLLSGYIDNRGSFIVITEAKDPCMEVSRQSFTIHIAPLPRKQKFL